MAREWVDSDIPVVTSLVSRLAAISVAQQFLVDHRVEEQRWIRILWGQAQLIQTHPTSTATTLFIATS